MTVTNGKKFEKHIKDTFLPNLTQKYILQPSLQVFRVRIKLKSIGPWDQQMQQCGIFCLNFKTFIKTSKATFQKELDRVGPL